MISACKNQLKYFQFESTEFSQVNHAIFTRLGGVSPKPWNSLNQGGLIGDSRENVIENRKRVFDIMNRSVDSIFDVWQIHSTTVICTDHSRKLDAPHEKADAIFTNNPNITLFMRFADCVPILIYEPNKKVIGIIHAGWKGSVNNIVKESISVIKERYGIDPCNIIAGIGPSIGPDHFEIREDVEKIVLQLYPKNSSDFLSERKNKKYLDLWQLNSYLLNQEGVKKVEISKICTSCNIKDWFSHRAEKGLTGRFCALINLRN